MAIKRSFSVKDRKFCCCLTCGAQIIPGKLKDDSVYMCGQCGQKMTVDRYGSSVVLTVLERQDLRRRIPPEVMNAAPQQRADILKLLQEKEYLKAQLTMANNKIIKCRQEARDWQQAAEGLARAIEEMKEREDAPKNDTKRDVH